jgi:hypothetical protein
VKIVNAESHLFQVIGTLHSSCGFSGCLYSRQQKGNQHTDDCNDDEKFDESESVTALP